MLEYLIKGGIMMIPLTACSVVMLAVLMDRTIAFYRDSRLDVRSLRSRVLALLGEDRLKEAMALCGTTPGPVPAVMLAGLKVYQTSRARGLPPVMLRTLVQKAMDDYAPQAIHTVELRLYWLATISNVAPLFGMTGTVTGMIRSFGSFAGAGALDAGAVGAGISEALVATASGLIIALASLIPYNSFMNRSQKILLEIGEAAWDLVEFVAINAEAEAKK